MRCYTCDAVFTSKEELFRHKDAAHGAGSGAASGGSATAPSRGRSQRGAQRGRSRGSGSSTTCRQCGEPCASKQDLASHLATAHPQPVERRTCNVCASVFPSRTAMFAHIRTEHEDGADAGGGGSASGGAAGHGQANTAAAPDDGVVSVRRRTCRQCKQVFDTQAAMFRHKDEAHGYYQSSHDGAAASGGGTDGEEPGVDPTTCRKCGIKFRAHADMFRHVKVVHGMEWAPVPLGGRGVTNGLEGLSDSDDDMDGLLREGGSSNDMVLPSDGAVAVPLDVSVPTADGSHDSGVATPRQSNGRPRARIDRAAADRFIFTALASDYLVGAKYRKLLAQRGYVGVHWHSMWP